MEDGETNEKFGINKVKRVVNMAATILLLLTGCGDKGSIKTIEVGPGATLTSIVKDSLGLPDEVTSDLKLRNILIEDIARQNGIADKNTIGLGSVLKVDMGEIEDSVDSYMEKEYGIVRKGKSKDKKENKESASYITIHSLEEFKNCDNYLVKNLYNDKNVNWMFFKALKDGYSIKFLKSRETDKSPSLSLDEITKPKEILGEELKGKTFVLDPGHGSLDIGSVGLAQYGDAKNKEKITVYEAPTMMDFTYRVARLLRAHGAKVYLTHYMNRRGILDVKDLPPCSMVRDEQNKGVFQDIWDGMPQDTVGSFFNANGSYVAKRAKIANKHNPNVYMSIHADYLGSKDKQYVNDQSKILSFKCDERQVKHEQSESFAKSLFENGFGYYYNGKLAKDVRTDVVYQHLLALLSAKSIATLLETANICQENQAYILRLPEKREELAQSLVDAIVIYFNNEE